MRKGSIIADIFDEEDFRLWPKIFLFKRGHSRCAVVIFFRCEIRVRLGLKRARAEVKRAEAGLEQAGAGPNRTTAARNRATAAPKRATN
ncbi:hypothetical protein [Lentibacillus sp.]|uniref:hypothetical protein n=1 Tax=Lentibacillus sp. TaxID=1925746 RepID=UPI002B4B4EBE|nr:hypothetical protein [Lentibacillus sp.]HLS08501.1 hypothetical protein [Lentibacillus sp.]